MTAVRVRRSYLALFVVVVVLGVFYSALFAEILSVDDDQLMTGLLNMDGWTWKGVFAGGGAGYYYRPLLALGWYFDNFVWGAHQSFMHLENVLLHAANALLVFCITRDLAARYHEDSPYLPLTAALLFGLHPLTTEPVNWISGRTDLLAGFFVFAAMLLLLKALAGNSLPLFAAAACSYLIGALGKETAVFWFPAALFFIYCARREEQKEPGASRRSSLLRTCSPYLLLSMAPAGYFLLRHLAFSKEDGAINLAVRGISGGDYDLLNRLRVMTKVLGFYFRKIVLPLPLNFATISVPNWYVPAGIAAILLCVWLLYRRSTFSALLLMAACIISPALLVPLGRMAWTPVAERYLYMPIAFVIIAAVVCGARWSARAAIPATVVATLVAAMVVASGYVTYRRNLVWQHNLTLFQDCVEKSPDFAPAKNELARALQNCGRYEEARKIFLSVQVPATDKYRIISEINRSNVMADGHDVKGAIENLKRLNYTPSQPAYDEYLKALIRYYAKEQDKESEHGRWKELQLKQIGLVKELQERTGDIYLFYRLGQMYLAMKDYPTAARYFQMAGEKAPASAFYKKAALAHATTLLTKR